MKTRLLAAILVISLLGGRAAAETIVIGGLDGIDPYTTEDPLPVGLALSGGGVRGLAAVGMLKAFEERGLQVEAIAGTSIGGIVGGLYACGYSADELREFIRDVDFSMLLSNRPHRSTMFLSRRLERERYLLSMRFDGLRPVLPQALSAAQVLTPLITGLTARAIYLADHDFDRLPIPFRAIATDVASGRLVVFSRGSLADAIRASMAFPLAFTGLERGDSLLMDGGMLVPVPVEMVRGMVDSGTFVVAVNTTSPLLERDQLTNALEIANQVTSIMTADKLQAQLDRADYVVTPIADEFNSMDFDDCDSIISIGYHRAQAAADSIVALIRTHTNHVLYIPSALEVYCPDSALKACFEQAGLDRPFSRRQLIADLATMVRTEPAFRVAATLERLPADSSSAEGDTVPVRLILEIEPQAPVSAVTFRFEGNSTFDDLALASLLDSPGTMLSARDLRRARLKIIDAYRSAGYDLANVRNVEFDREAFEVTFVIDEGTVRRFDVIGNRRTRDWLVRSYFAQRSGKPFSTDATVKGLEDLYGTELFERVSFELAREENAPVMTVSVKERKYSQVRFGWHWHDEYRSEEFVELLDDNVNGIGLEFLTHLQYGPDREVYSSGLRLDRIFFTYLTAHLGLSYSLLDRHLFDSTGTASGYRDEDRWGVSFAVGQQLARLGHVVAGFDFERVEIQDHRDRTARMFDLRTFRFQSTIEDFDQYPFPTRGRKNHFDLRFAGELFGGEAEYTRFFGSLEAYFPLLGPFNYHPRVAVGLSRSGLPVSEKFYVGGLHSFAGYRTNELSGDKMLLVNQELRINLPLWLYLVGHFDLGDVYGSAEDIKLSKLRQGFAVSLALDSPIGPFELGYGGGDSPKDRWYFSAGLEF